MLHRFTTRASSRLERSRQWIGLTKAHDVQFDDDREASLHGGEYGPLRLCIVSMGRHRVAQPAGAEGRGAAPTFKFLFQDEGTATIRQGGRSHEINPGQWCALRKDMPFVIDAPAHSRQLAITVSCERLADARHSIEWWRQPRTFLRGPAQILHASASASVMAGGSLSTHDQEQIGHQILLLAQMTLRADDPGAPLDVREVRRFAILEYIDRHLAENCLGVTMIARAFDMSSRSVHKLFEGQPHTVARAIWERRLVRCREEMVDPSLASRSITEIAHLWGFSDSQHFSRAFKQRYGVTPRDYRNLFSLH